MSERKDKIMTVTTNRKATHEYFVLETVEAGIVLLGNEVKSVRVDKMNINDCYAVFEAGALILRGSRINPYEKASFFASDATRDRKLLLNRHEIRKLYEKVTQKGMTVVPLRVYFKGSLLKVELGLCRGKHTYDKKESLKEKDIERDTARRLKEGF
jgi:SsrA-binding protein